LSDEARDLAFRKILFYLGVLRKHIVSIDEENYRITVSDSPPNMPGEKVSVEIIVGSSWVRIYAVALEDLGLEELNMDAIGVLAGILRLQDEYMEFSFALGKEGELVIKQDIHIGALTLDVFEEEYEAILAAYERFSTKIAPLIREAKKLSAERMVEIW